MSTHDNLQQVLFKFMVMLETNETLTCLKFDAVRFV
jgi:hypothetical protein